MKGRPRVLGVLTFRKKKKLTFYPTSGPATVSRACPSPVEGSSSGSRKAASRRVSSQRSKPSPGMRLQASVACLDHLVYRAHQSPVTALYHSAYSAGCPSGLRARCPLPWMHTHHRAPSHPMSQTRTQEIDYHLPPQPGARGTRAHVPAERRAERMSCRRHGRNRAPGRKPERDARSPGV